LPEVPVIEVRQHKTPESLDELALFNDAIEEASTADTPHKAQHQSDTNGELIPHHEKWQQNVHAEERSVTERPRKELERIPEHEDIHERKGH